MRSGQRVGQSEILKQVQQRVSTVTDVSAHACVCVHVKTVHATLYT